MPLHGTGITEVAEVLGRPQDITAVALEHIAPTATLLPQGVVAPTDEAGP